MDIILERAAGELKKLNIRRQAIEGIRVRVRMLEMDAVGFGGMDFERMRTNGKHRKRSGRVGTVEERERLQQQEQVLQCWIEHTEQTMRIMHPDDERILRVFYCENRKSGDAVRILMDELHVSQTEIYRMRERALREFAERMGYLT